MKGLTLLLVFLSISFSALAQGPSSGSTWGVKAGANFLGFRTDDTVVSQASRVGWHGGIYSMIRADDWLFRIEGTLSSLGAKLETQSEIQENRIFYIQVPLILQYQASEWLNFQLGVYTGFRITAKRSLTNKTDNTTTTSTNTEDVVFFDYGPVGGVGVILPIRMGFELKYNVGIPNSNANSTVNIKTNNQFWQLSMLYNISK